jgi:hypothetical protein
MRVIFFNCFHNGDIHVSRGMVRLIINKVRQIDPNTTFEYAHKNPGNLLADINGLTYNTGGLSYIRSEHDNLIRPNHDTVLINTWYARQHHKYMNQHGITLDSLYAALSDSCRQVWGFRLDDLTQDVREFFPIIDYGAFHLESARRWLSHHPERKVLVENGQALSGQADNFPMNPIINRLATEFPETTFILTHDDKSALLPNMVQSSRIIQKTERSDLNEISFLSTHCDLIIGRASGAFTFCLTQENMFHRSPAYLCFANIETSSGKYWIGDLLKERVNYSAQLSIDPEIRPDHVANTIREHLTHAI